MNWEASVERRESIPLVGMRADMSFTGNRTRELWQSFRARSQEVLQRKGQGFYSVQYYENFADMTPTSIFSKWACVEVDHHDTVPPGMEAITLPEGLWASFLYKGTVAQFPKMWSWIFSEWLPQSGYVLADGYHYEYLDHRWLGPQNEESVEDVYIPVEQPVG